MIKKLLIYALLVVFLVSCGQKAGEKTALSEITEATITEVLNNPLEFDGKEVRIAGIISHVCKNSGDKMRVTQGDSELSILVKLGTFTGQITPENEGHNVVFEGKLSAALNKSGATDYNAEAEGHVCASTEEAIAKMKEQGIKPEFTVSVELSKFELK